MGNPNFGKEGAKGGRARAKKLSRKRMSEIGRMGAIVTNSIIRRKKALAAKEQKNSLAS